MRISDWSSGVCSSDLLFVCYSICLAQNRVKYNFNPQWKLLLEDIPEAKKVNFDEAVLNAVSYPSACNDDDAFRLDIDKHTSVVVWYRYLFKFPASDQGNNVLLAFSTFSQTPQL